MRVRRISSAFRHHPNLGYAQRSCEPPTMPNPLLFARAPLLLQWVFIAVAQLDPSAARNCLPQGPAYCARNPMPRNSLNPMFSLARNFPSRLLRPNAATQSARPNRNPQRPLA